jgi:pyruvate dehydrogenase E2 component (dihydrolipoamide acetyltransferase)
MARLMPMPKLSDTMEEGAIAKWMKKVGDKISEGDPLAEIETDKATMEYEAPETGYILKLVVDSGGRAKVGAPIAVIGDSKDEAFDMAALGSAGTASDAKAQKPDQNKATAPAPNAPRPAAPASVSHLSAAPASPAATSSGRVKASPLARRMAEERGIDLSRVTGSGPAGRIVMRDVESGKTAGAAPSMPVFQGTPGQDQSLRVTMMRQTIAKRLHAAKNDAPHFYLTRSIDMTAVNAWRERLNHNVDEKSGQVKVSVNDLVILAVAKALRKHPMVNASWQGDTITQFGNVHVAMAVALPEGLVTPVIRHTDQLGARQIAQTTKALAAKARAGQLTNDDFAGGTFTISNLGMMGIEEFTAIINPPQAAILAVGTTIKTPVVDEDDQIVVKPMMKVTMSCDHRVVDGMVGAQFLQTLVSYLEDPAMMLG